MGWKTFKEHFGIEHHVCINEEGNILIGSGYICDLLVVDSKTGELKANNTFPAFLKDHYPALLNVSPEDVLKLIQAEDNFSASIPVYTYDGGEIIEKFCEEPGWPNCTHDGFIMYENTFSTNKERIIRRAKESATIEIKYYQDRILDAEQKLSRLKEELTKSEENLKKLEQSYPKNMES